MRPSKSDILQAALTKQLTSSASPVLPSERALAEEFKVNRLTVQRALLKMEQGGHIRKVPGRGYVRSSAVETMWPILQPAERYVGFPIWYDSLADADWLRSPYTATLIRGIQEALLLEGFQLDIAAVGHADAPATPKIHELAKRWKAVIRTSPPEGSHDVDAFSHLMDHTVFVDYASNLCCNRVSPDLVRAGELAMRALLASGAERVLYLGRLDDRSPSNFARSEGLNRALAEYPQASVFSANADTRMEDGYQAVLHLIRTGEKFDAIIALSDHSAIGAIRACYENRISVPEQVQVVAFGGLPISAYTVPSLTTVDLHITQTGHEAGRMAVHLVRQNGKPQPIHDISVSLIQGETTKSMPQRLSAMRISSKNAYLSAHALEENSPMNEDRQDTRA